jgi:protein-L-isoaspartate(D-aspartate) O-methyltransferase
LPEFAPYDRILASATTRELPASILDQLKEGGKMVIPIKDDIWEIKKESQGYNVAVHSGYVFVPLVT